MVPSLINLLKSFDNEVKVIVYFEKTPGKKCADQNTKGIKIISYDELLKLGKNDQNKIPEEPVEHDAKDVSCIMYTSGSTGTPKGVVLSHRNIIQQLACSQMHFNAVIRQENVKLEDMTYIAYLPMTHIMELGMVYLCLISGIRVGFSSPFTLTDVSPKLATGVKGDLSILKPTIMSAVPLMMNRFYKGIKGKVESKGKAFSQFFDFCYNYKSKWYKRGFDTPFINAILFDRIKLIVGGKLKFCFVGGALLDEDVHEFFRLVLAPITTQGYGLTESCAGFAVGDGYEKHGEIGSVRHPDYHMKLESWEDGGYTIHDKVGPRGEIVISGPGVSDYGYYKCENGKANDDFCIDGKGRRWFRTGDIGQINPATGNIKVIDRRKDLAKLQNGEYLSLGKVEAVLTSHPAIEMACVCLFESKSVVIAIPNPQYISNVKNEFVPRRWR